MIKYSISYGYLRRLWGVASLQLYYYLVVSTHSLSVQHLRLKFGLTEVSK